MYETTHQSLTLASSSPTNQTMPGGYNRLASFSSSSMANHHLSPNQNSYAMNLLHFSREGNTNSSTVTQISPKGDDGYGFIWDMDLEEHSLEDGGVASNLDGMRFEVDNNNNNMVLL